VNSFRSLIVIQLDVLLLLSMSNSGFEANLTYVGLTRATSRIVLTAPLLTPMFSSLSFSTTRSNADARPSG
jgi:ATP-dependent exoDNAse (exonuclease V) alpha subunit